MREEKRGMGGVGTRGYGFIKYARLTFGYPIR